MKTRYRLGLDLGTNSIGWALVALDNDGKPNRLLKTGVRIFSDGRNPKDRTSNAVSRRLARQQRRRRDRYLKRKQRLMMQLIHFGIMPEVEPERKSLEALDPYELRAKALDQELSLPELGRAIFHLNQRRGFVSTRKDKGDDNEKGKIKQGIARLQDKLDDSNSRTLGEYLFKRREEGHTTRARLNGEGAKAFYDFYVHRHMVEDELKQIWLSQKKFHPESLTDDKYEALRDTILFQRPLLPVEPGPCTLNPKLKRAPVALPSVARFRILQELNNLKIVDENLVKQPLTLIQRNTLRDYLWTRAKATFDQLRNKLKLPEEYTFNLESSNRRFLLGNPTGHLLANKKGFHKEWLDLSLQDQDQLVDWLLQEADEESVIDRLMEEYGLTEEAAEYVSNVQLQDGHSNLSREVIGDLLPHLEADLISYDKACRAAGYHHSQLYTGEFYERLPYYGELLPHYVAPAQRATGNAEETRYGKINNPTVHIALNQVRKVVNSIIEQYGNPFEIVVEVARDLKVSERKRREILSEQRANQKRNERLKEKLQEIGISQNATNLLKLKLWEEINENDPANRCCIYTGEKISVTRMFAPDSDIEIEHILPFSISLDDGIANKTLCIRRANQFKGNSTPYQAFSQSPSPYDWEEILQRVQHLPLNKRWRFSEEAHKRGAEESDFLARHLSDTAYIARVAKQYLNFICEGGPDGVWVTPGKLTSLLRAKWGLNHLLSSKDFKNRNDQRHHAIDAAVVAVTDRGLLQRVSRAASQSRSDRLIESMPAPWEGYRLELERDLRRCVVSYKPDHGVQGALHNDTAYGLVEERADGKYEVVHRVPAHTLNKRKDIERIRDAGIREKLIELLSDRKEIPREELNKWLEQSGIRRLRVVDVLSIIPIQNATGFYKAYKGDSNYCYEIFSHNGAWKGRIVSTYQANQPDYQAFMHQSTKFHKETFEGEPLMMRLCKGDYVACGENENRKIYQLVKFSKGKLSLAEHNEGGNLKTRDEDKGDPFRYLTKSPNALRTSGFRKVLVDPLGRVFDPQASHGRQNS